MTVLSKSCGQPDPTALYVIDPALLSRCPRTWDWLKLGQMNNDTQLYLMLDHHGTEKVPAPFGNDRMLGSSLMTLTGIDIQQHVSKFG